MQHYLSKGEIAEYLGISLNTVKTYTKRPSFPEPDARVGRNFGWLRETIDEWLLNRPGPGARTDLYDH